MPIQLRSDQAFLLVVDLQTRLLPAIAEREAVVRRSEFLIRAARALGWPIVWSEQYRKGLGETEPAIVEAIGDAARPIEKMAFGCMNDPAIAEEIQKLGRSQMVLCGIEAHVCVLQTALTALGKGLEVFVAEDAISSRRLSDRETAIRRMTQAGCVPATSEMLVMESLGCAGGEQFKAILPLVKEI